MADSYYLFSSEVVLQKKTKRNAESLVLFPRKQIIWPLFESSMFKETHLPRSAFAMNSFIPFSVTKNRSKNAAPSDRAQHQTFVAGKSESMSQHLLKKNHHHHHHNHYYYCSWLVVSTYLKNSSQILVKLDHFPRVRGANKKYLSCHHPGSCDPFLYFTIPKAPSSLPSNERPSLTTSSKVEALRRSPQRKSARNSGRPEACALEHKVPEEVTGSPKGSVSGKSWLFPPNLREVSIRKGRMKDVCIPGIDFTKEGI